MMVLSGQFLDIMVIIMLAIVGGLVLWLHYSLYSLKNTDKVVPSLVDSLSDSLQKAHRGVFELSRLVREEGPKLEKEAFDAQQTAQDLDYMLGKAERLLKRMDEAFEKADVFSTPAIAAVKAQEKNALLGQTPKITSPQQVMPRVKAPETVEKPSITEASKHLEAEMQKTLERELLMGLQSENNTPEQQLASISEEQPKRMASPMYGAKAYGQTIPITDAERDLRQALEGRL